MRLLITYNRQLTTKRKAFTLMEVLIAASIFAGIMIIATGVFGQSSSYRGKIKAMREVNEDSKTIADQITRDVRTANNSITVVDHSETLTFKNGVALLNCGGSDCTFNCDATVCYCLPGLPSDCSSPNLLIIANKDKYIVYAQKDKFLYRSSVDGSFSLTSILAYNTATALTAVPISASNLETEVTFRGYAPGTTATNLQQSFVQFDIISKTKNYDSLPAQSRAQAEIRSSVTVRNFAN